MIGTNVGKTQKTPSSIYAGCGLEGCLYDSKDAPTLPWKAGPGCKACPDCFAGDTEWTKGIILKDNVIVP